jgi:recombination protein RecR
VLALLKWNKQQLEEFGELVQSIHEGPLFCTRCFYFSDEDLCSICKDPQRQHNRIAVVEHITDLIAIENTGLFKGVYHVLGGTINPSHGSMPHQLRIQELTKRIETLQDTYSDTEVIIATSANTHGETTALYLEDELKGIEGITITRLGRGLSAGATIEYVDALTLSHAIKHRK